ncbi:MAG: hypothetical protein ACRCZI_11450 [Cetobacterium sp.]
MKEVELPEGWSFVSYHHYDDCLQAYHEDLHLTLWREPVFGYDAYEWELVTDHWYNHQTLCLWDHMPSAEEIEEATELWLLTR